MRSREARGSVGGGTDVSSGGSSGIVSGAGGAPLVGGGAAGVCGRRGGKGVRAARRAGEETGVSLAPPCVARGGLSGAAAAAAVNAAHAQQQDNRRNPASALVDASGGHRRLPSAEPRGLPASCRSACSICRSSCSWRNGEPPLL